MKLPLQKSTNNDALVRKSPRVRYRYRIVVGTKWQSSRTMWKHRAIFFKGEPQYW